jgi:hypothetical protein
MKHKYLYGVWALYGVVMWAWTFIEFKDQAPLYVIAMLPFIIGAVVGMLPNSTE